MTQKLTGIVVFGVLTVLWSMPGQAHIKMIYPKPRLDVDNLKQSSRRPDPCGNQVRGTNPYVYEPGQSVSFRFTETINHPGRFKVQFSPANDQGFDLPQNELAKQEDTMRGGDREIIAKMPMTECSNCSLRVIQVMDDQPGELYVHCIDINIKAKAQQPPGKDGEDEEVGKQGSKDDANKKKMPGFGGYFCGSIGSSTGNGSPPSSTGLLFLLLPFLLIVWVKVNSPSHYLSKVD